MSDSAPTPEPATPSDAAASFAFANITRGDPVAPLAQLCPALQFKLDGMAGRYTVLCFYLSASDHLGAAALHGLQSWRRQFGPDHVSFCCMGVDRAGPLQEADGDIWRDVTFVLDRDRQVCRTFGVLPRQPGEPGKPIPTRPCWMVIDPTLHVLATFPFSSEGQEQSAVVALLHALPPPARYSPVELPPPVLLLPNVFEEALCQRLIAAYERDGGRETGVVINSQTVVNAAVKRRRDYAIQERDLIVEAHRSIRKRILPEIERLFFMQITNMDRNIVACYAAEDGGHFLQPHRDNNSDVTAYRRFAVSINLNGDFDGGGVQFPEYNQTEYRAPPGWALVFPCAILHRVTRVTRGRRYVFLPFVFDEAGARLRAVKAAAAPAA